MVFVGVGEGGVGIGRSGRCVALVVGSATCEVGFGRRVRGSAALTDRLCKMKDELRYIEKIRFLAVVGRVEGPRNPAWYLRVQNGEGKRLLLCDDKNCFLINGGSGIPISCIPFYSFPEPLNMTIVSWSRYFVNFWNNAHRLCRDYSTCARLRTNKQRK